MHIYLDNAATTRVCDEAAQKALEVMTQCYGNPSSTHALGRSAKKELENARAKVAHALGADASEIYFTSCGTESDNWAIIRGAHQVARHGKHIITSEAEHDAVRRTMDAMELAGFEVTRLKPDKTGAIPAEKVADALRQDTAFVSLMLVNNETGAVTDIAAISRILRERCPKALLHTDAVQAFLKIPFTARQLGADLISISGHKIHAPKGIGALYIRKGLRLNPSLLGGSQESGRRAGTEALPQIAAMGVAAELGKRTMAESTVRMRGLRELAIARLITENPGLQIIGGGAPHILSISLPGYKSEVLMNFLEAQGIYVSKSSACKKGGRSHVLESMGLKNEIIDGALRISFSRYTTTEEVNTLCDNISMARLSLLTVLR